MVGYVLTIGLVAMGMMFPYSGRPDPHPKRLFLQVVCLRVWCVCGVWCGVCGCGVCGCGMHNKSDHFGQINKLVSFKIPNWFMI